MDHVSAAPLERSEVGVQAHLVKGLRQTRVSDDGKYGLLGFERVRPDGDGNNDIWLGVARRALPTLAIEALRLMPQPDHLLGDRASVLRAAGVIVGKSPDGDMMLEFHIEPGVSLTIQLPESEGPRLLKAFG